MDSATKIQQMKSIKRIPNVWYSPGKIGLESLITGEIHKIAIILNIPNI